MFSALVEVKEVGCFDPIKCPWITGAGHACKRRKERRQGTLSRPSPNLCQEGVETYSGVVSIRQKEGTRRERKVGKRGKPRGRIFAG